MTDAEIEAIIFEASKERARRAATGVGEPPPKEGRVELGPPFLPTLTHGRFTLRVYSAFFGWLAFAWHKEGLEKLNSAAQAALDSGRVTPRSFPHAEAQSPSTVVPSGHETGHRPPTKQ